MRNWPASAALASFWNSRRVGLENLLRIPISIARVRGDLVQRLLREHVEADIVVEEA